LLAEATLAPTFKPEIGAEATPTSGPQGLNTHGSQGPAYPAKGERLGTRAGNDVSVGSIMRGGRTAADPYEASKLVHRCRPVTELEVA
jgi:hypothetical protein